ncbi:MAG: DUF3048 domain-containing protein, partial [Chloroflexota bacterium]
MVKRTLIFTLVVVGMLAACTATSTPATAQVTVTPGVIPLDGGVVIPEADDSTPTEALLPTATELPPPTQAETDAPPTSPPPPTATVLPADFIGPDTYPDNVNPLTGLAVDDPTVLNRRPMIAKISNAPPLVRPQAGIGMADIVYEHYAEGGLTRFSAVFYSNTPQRVGSIRSGRLIDFELAAMYRALLTFSGASTGVEEQIYGSEAIGIAEARLAEGREIVPPSDFAERAFRGVTT